LARKLTEFQSRATTQLFAERFIRGREVNVSILACPEGPKVLPPAEILFPNFPEGKPRVVGYNAKWAEGSFEYENTPRTFDFSSRDGGLLEQVRKIAIQCWTQFELRGYARVDFRIDENDRPWVLGSVKSRGY